MTPEDKIQHITYILADYESHLNSNSYSKEDCLNFLRSYFNVSRLTRLSNGYYGVDFNDGTPSIEIRTYQYKPENN